jgi:hypothetical protein
VVANQTTNSGSKIVAFFGSDLARAKAGRFLSRAHKKGYRLLALDSSGMAAAARAEVPYVVLDDVVPTEDVYEAHVQADYCQSSWYEAARDDFTVDGCCWPNLEAGMRYFWSNTTLALKLAQTLTKTGVKEFRFFQHWRPRPQVTHGKSDACAVLWEAELPGIARPIITLEEFRLPRVYALARRVLRRLNGVRRQQARGVSQDDVPASGGIFIVMGDLEALRFSDSIEQLSRSFPGQIFVAAAGPCPPDCEPLPWKKSVPIRHGPSYAVESWIPGTIVRVLSRRTPELAQRFLRGYEKARDCAAGKPWQRALETLRFHFEYYCLYRWPKLHSENMRFWAELWAKHRPQVVLASSVEDCRFRLMVAAAKSLGIPTLGIPHGGMVGCPGHLISPVVDDILYSTGLQKASFERRDVPGFRMHACRDLVATNEYRVIRSKAFASRRRLHMLALTDTTDEGTNLGKLVGLRAQYTALKALLEAPSDLAHDVEVRVKVHPQYHDLPMIEAVGPELMAKVLPRNSDLHEVLESTDVVVAVNYYGSALIHAFREGKPVVQFLTVHDSMVMSKLNLFSLFLPGSAIARTKEEFWAVVRSVLTDTAFMRDLQLRAQQFARNYLDDTRYPAIDEVVTALGFMDPKLNRSRTVGSTVNDRPHSCFED